MIAIGDVNYLDQANATASKLAYVNDAGRVIITVDNTTSVPYNYKRDSVRVVIVYSLRTPSRRHRSTAI